MKHNRKSSSDARLNARTRRIFLDHLAGTANVSGSARLAGVSGGAMYSQRRRSAEFRAEWALALAEGYARLETNLLAEALQSANGNTADGTLKARAQKHRLAISLLRAHGAAVKGGASQSAPTTPKQDLRTMKAALILKLTQMRDRADKALKCPKANPDGDKNAAA